ncbi:MAG TPA: hypothetical protein VJ963_05550 [Bacteroidales bacterium]|nr:hypothetical protein [Bacteroidales bacterium]
MKVFPLIALFLSVGASLFSQNLVGFRESEIRKYMQENHKDMNIADTKNSKFRYLKYSDNLDNQTILFFLKKNSVCYSERMICDFSIKNEKLREFEKLYRKDGENRWVDTKGDKNYLITIKEGQWSFIVTIEPEN